MTKGELIKKLQAAPGDDDTQVSIMDYRLNLADDMGDGSSEGIYSDFDVDWHNHDLNDDEIERMIEVNDIEPKLFITLSFESESTEDDSVPEDGRAIAHKAWDSFKGTFQSHGALVNIAKDATEGDHAIVLYVFNGKAWVSEEEAMEEKL